MFEWDDKYSVNVSIIDEEHNNNPEEVLDVLEEMIEYALKHFTTEEIYMVKFKYPEYQSHIGEHHAFSMKAVNYCYRATKDDCQITDDLLEYLQQWLVEHIQETDKKHTDCFNKNGLK